MQRYFFDVAVQSHVEYDYRGRALEKAEEACKLAELIALDRECIEGGELAGGEVQVRDVSGAQLFAVPIRYPGPIAA